MRQSSLFILFAFLLANAAPSRAHVFDDFVAQKIQSRTQWGARPAKNDMTPDPRKEIFAIHHSAGAAMSDDATVRNIQKYHMDVRGWSDIGYHFLVGPDGKIFEGRSLNFTGAHVYGHNKGSIGLNFLGCYDAVECQPPAYPAVSNVTDAMVQAMGELIGMLAFRYDAPINTHTVRGHKEFSGTHTACPGDRVMQRAHEIRKIADVMKVHAERLAKANQDDL